MFLHQPPLAMLLFGGILITVGLFVTKEIHRDDTKTSKAVFVVAAIIMFSGAALVILAAIMRLLGLGVR